MLNMVDMAWLAGLMEGEGSFGIYGGSPCIQMMSNDRDIVQRAATFMKVCIAGPFQPKRKSGSIGTPYKTVFGLKIFGSLAIGWMQTLYQFFGERRKEKIRSVIAAWKIKPRRPNGPLWKEGRSRPDCHPERAMRAKGLCNSCYMSLRRKRLKENAYGAGR